jgi:hypothetical protein
MNVPGRERLLRLGADAALTLLASVVAFSVAAVLTTIANPDVPVVVVGALYAVVVWVVARHRGFLYAVPVAMACLLAVDWFYILRYTRRPFLARREPGHRRHVPGGGRRGGPYRRTRYPPCRGVGGDTSRTSRRATGASPRGDAGLLAKIPVDRG